MPPRRHRRLRGARARRWGERLPRLRPHRRRRTARGRGRPGRQRAEPVDSGDVIAVRLIEPLHSNAAALGVNGLSIPAARAAIQQAVDTGNATATAGFRLTQQDEADKRMGVVIYQAHLRRRDGRRSRRAPGRAARRRLRHPAMDTLLGGVVGQVPAYLKLCLVDADPPRATAAPRRAARAARPSAPACSHERPIVFAGRQLGSCASAPRPAPFPAAPIAASVTIAAVGLLSAAMLGASLLITTGRTRRIESAVRERTAALRAEVSERQAAETALRASEQRFRNILDNVPIGVVYTDLRRPRHPGQSALLRADRLRRARAGGAEPRGADPPGGPRQRRDADRAAGRRRDPDVPAPQALPEPRRRRRLGALDGLAAARRSQRAVAHRRRRRGHHRAPAPGGGRAGARGGRGREPRQERLPLAHEPRAAHAAQRHARLRPAARDRPRAIRSRPRSGRGSRRSSRPAGTCSR